MQYSWPPADPTRLPNPDPPRGNASAFVYGNEGFNPALRPSSAALRARSRDSSHPQPQQPGDTGWDGVDGTITEYSEESDDASGSSSPERYLSDYDEHDEGPMGAGERMAGSHMRVRRGSEGYEIRSGVAGWDVEAGNRPPWEREGRYNYYVPDGQGGA